MKKRNNKKKIMAGIGIFIFLIYSGFCWLQYELFPVMKICLMREGTIFTLSSVYDFEWDEVEIVNTPTNRASEEIRELSAEWEKVRPREDWLFHRTCTILMFYKDGEIFHAESFNYMNSDFPILCWDIPIPSYAAEADTYFYYPSDRCIIPRGSDHFQIMIGPGGKVIAVLCE